MSFELVGSYHEDSCGGGTHTIACGWPDLRIGKIIYWRATP
jgi:hypothetical protein